MTRLGISSAAWASSLWLHRNSFEVRRGCDEDNLSLSLRGFQGCDAGGSVPSSTTHSFWEIALSIYEWCVTTWCRASSSASGTRSSRLRREYACTKGARLESANTRGEKSSPLSPLQSVRLLRRRSRFAVTFGFGKTLDASSRERESRNRWTNSHLADMRRR